MNDRAHIFLYGPSGSGKSTLARLLAESLNLPTIDLDDEITRQAGRSIAEIFAAQGEQAFRQIESELLQKAARQPESVIALGGGTLLDAENRRLAEATGEVVCLHASPAILLERLDQDDEIRPLLKTENGLQMERYLADRQAHYQSFPVQLDNGSLTPDEAVSRLQQLSGRYHLHGMQPYQVRITRGIFAALGSFVPQRNLILITDETVGDIYCDRIEQVRQQGLVRQVIRIAPGEASKSLETLEAIWEQLLMFGADRSTCLLALGGGMIGDLVGFAAATFMRGIPWINLPSTLLAQVDASIGGKTGINLPQGKNLVGAFYPPEKVLIDPDLLDTLPKDEIANGMAEVIKHAVIAGPPLLSMCRDGFPQSPEARAVLVRAAAAVKVRVVEADPYESQLRAILNFGHTLGHAVEKNSRYRLKHGQAVSIGMAVETYLAERIGLAESGLCDQLCRILTNNQLPVRIPADQDTATLLDTARFDKKSRAGRLTFALPSAIGAVHPGILVDNLEQLIDDYRHREE